MDWPYNTPCVFKNIRLRFTLWILLRWPEAIRVEGPRESNWRFWPFLLYVVLNYTANDIIQWSHLKLRRFWDAVYPFLVFAGEGVISIAEWVSHFKGLCYRCGFRRLCVAWYRDWKHHVLGRRWHH